MTVRHYALGHLNPVVYYENARGEISLPPSTEAAMQIRDHMTKRGWELREADTLDKIDRLQKRMQDQEHAARERQLEHEENLLATSRKSVRDRLMTRMVSSATTPYERKFIESYLMLHDNKRDEYRKRFMQDQCYFESREFDGGHHMLDTVNAIPEGRDVACKRCHQFRRVKNSDYCGRCGGLSGR